MAENDVSIIIRVNDSEAEKLRKVAASGKQLDDAMKGASVSMRQLDQAQQAVASTGAEVARVNRQIERSIRDSIEAESAMQRAMLDAQSAIRQRAQAVQDGIAKELAALKERNALLGLSTQLERTNAQAALGRYSNYSAEQMQALRNLQAEYDAKQRSLKQDQEIAAAIAAEVEQERRYAAALRESQAAARQRAQAVQDGIQRDLAGMRQRNALIGATTELERVERQIRLGNYAAYNAAQLTELRNLAAQYDAQMRLLNVERQRAAARSGVGNFATGALSYAGVGFGANALGGGIAVAGSTYFASRTAIEFERAEQAILATTGSLVEAERQMEDVEVQARRLGINITDLARLWARFQAASQGTSLEGERARDIFLAVAEAAQRLSLRADEVQGVLRAVEQMMSKGKIQAEELRGQLGDRLPGAFNIMARAIGVSTAELDKMLKSGEVMADEALPKFAVELRRTFSTDINSRIETTASNFQRLLNEIRLTAAAIGGGLNPVLSDTSGYLADLIAFARENPFEAIYRTFTPIGRYAQGGGLEGAVERFRAERAALEELQRQTPAFLNTDSLLRPGLNAPFYGPGTPTYSGPAPIDLTAGVTPVDPERAAKLREELALLGLKTEYQKTLWQYTEGELKNANAIERAMALQVAAAKDRANAEKEVAKEGKAALKIFDEQLRLHDAELLKLDAEQVELLRKSRQEREKWAEQLKLSLRTPDQIRAQNIVRLDEAYNAGDITADERTAALIKFNEEYYAALVRMDKEGEKTFGALTLYADQAARNIQSAFAEYLFDPFDASLSDMLANFTTALQRMAAEIAAAQLLAAAGNWGTANSGAGGLLGALATGVGAFFGAGAAPGSSAASSGGYQGYFDPSYGGGFSFGAPGGKSATASGERAAHRTIVSIRNYGNEQPTVERSQNANGDEIIDIVIGRVVRSIENNGPVGQSIARNYGLPRLPVKR